MAKLQEERIVSSIVENKSKSINRFKSIFLQCKGMKKPCQEKNEACKKIFPGDECSKHGPSAPAEAAKNPKVHLFQSQNAVKGPPQFVAINLRHSPSPEE
jgi:hypothetical protein